MFPAEKGGPVPAGSGVELVRDASGALCLTDGTMSTACDLSCMVGRLRPDRLGRELLVRAARIRGVPEPTVVDCTAGLGEDSLLLAAAGFRVTLFERDPVIAALLADGLARAAADPRLSDVVHRMELVEGDGVAGLAELGFSPDVVYLDPMFPCRTKSAAVKKKFQLLHHLERPCGDDEAVRLLRAALACGPRKVVIKRPAKGKVLAGARPSYSVSGKAVRYDCLVPPRP